MNVDTTRDESAPPRRGAGAFGERLNKIFRLPPAGVWRRIVKNRSVRAAFFVFVLTRAIVLTIFVVVGQVHIYPDPDNLNVTGTDLSLRRAPIARVLRRTVKTADANWYIGIADAGYERAAFDSKTYHNWAFFPLYPLLLWLASGVTGEFEMTGLVLSNLFLLGALILLHRLALEFGLDETTADRCIFYLAAFPTSYFFSVPMTESLFLITTVGSFYMAKRGAWWMAGVFGALASATRFTGILLLPALLILYWQKHRRFWPLRANLLSLLLIPTGLLCFMVYLYFVTGNPFAFKGAMAAWGRTTGAFWRPLYEYLSDPLVIAGSWNFKLLNFAAASTALACGVVLLKRREWALGCYTLLSVIIALSSVLLQSQARYAMVMFPAFMVLAVAARSGLVDQTIRAVSLVLLGLMTALFAAHFNVALS